MTLIISNSKGWRKMPPRWSSSVLKEAGGGGRWGVWTEVLLHLSARQPCRQGTDTREPASPSVDGMSSVAGRKHWRTQTRHTAFSEINLSSLKGWKKFYGAFWPSLWRRSISDLLRDNRQDTASKAKGSLPAKRRFFRKLRCQPALRRVMPCSGKSREEAGERSHPDPTSPCTSGFHRKQFHLQCGIESSLHP